jgi:hypothetical protein
MKRPLPVGLSDYKELVEEGYYYIDKTLLIRDLIQYGGKATLLPRPRRFGKTLNLSMLRYFFEEGAEETASLFHDKKIWQEERIRGLQGQFPVIFLTFKNVKDSNWEDAYQSIKATISDEYQRHASVLLPVLASFERKKYEAILEKTATKTDYTGSLLFLSRLLAKHYKKKVVFLLDEYDTPIHSAFQYSYYSPLIEFLRITLGSVLKDNSFLERGVITGIARIAKEGIFSDLNHLAVFSLLQSPASDKFGFTEEETSKLVHDYGFNDRAGLIKTWYNGYRIGPTKTIYNPWSIINCLNFDGEIRAYWGKTSSNDTIKQVIRAGDSRFKQELFSLLQEETVQQKVDEGLIYPGIEQNPLAAWSLLLYAGYLTFVETQLIDSYDYCQLKIPNLEMRHIFHQLITAIMEETTSLLNVEAMLAAMLRGDGKEFGAYFQEFISNSMSYYDLSHSMPENSYHMFVLGLLMLLQSDYEIKSNRESGFGRYDIMIIPRAKEKLGIIMEFKKCEPKETLEQAADKAFKQLETKDYAQEFRSRGIPNIVGYGLAFQGKEVQLQYGPLV